METNLLNSISRNLKPKSNLKDCEKLMLVHYVSVNGMDRAKALQMLSNYKARYIDDMDDTIINFIIPVREVDSRVECIHSANFTEEQQNTMNDIINRFNDAVTKFEQSV